MCLPKILFSEYALNLPACTDKHFGPDLNSAPPGPDSHTSHANYSAVTYATAPQGQAA